jgi:error-prone DNA polymerase
MTLRAHPMALLRRRFAERDVVPTTVLRTSKNDDVFTLAGLVLVRQRPGTASGVVFVTLEDEHGIANLVVWPKVFEAHRRIVMGSRLLAVHGTVQREGLVIHLVAETLWDWSAELDSISDIDDFRLTHGRGDQVRTDRPDPRERPPSHEPLAVPQANATRHRAPTPAANKGGYDRSRIHLDRPKIKIASRDFH